jgi:hypothetical protein
MSAACIGCTLRGAPETPANNSHGVCTTCASGPIHVPCDRVRLCSETIGTWSKASPLDAFQQWDTGKGAVVAARKFYLSPAPDGNVALVFRSDADASAADNLLGVAVVKPNQPLPLRHCAGAKGLCSSICFDSASDHSCLAHQRRPAAQHPASKRQRPTKPVQAAKKAKLDSTEGFLCGLLGDEEGDGLSFESLRQLCDVEGSGQLRKNDAHRLPSPVHSDSSRSTISAPSSPKDNDQIWPEFVGWEDMGAAGVGLGEGDLLNTLDELLGASASADDDVFDASACFGALLPNAPLTPNLALPAHLKVLERGPTPPAAKWAKPSAQAAKWRPRTDLNPTNKPSQVATPLPLPLPMPMPMPALKPAPKAKGTKSKCIWKSAIVL